MQETGFNPWMGKIRWSRKWYPPSVFLPGKSHGERSLADPSPWGRQELVVTSTAQHLPLPEIMSNIYLLSWSSLIPADINSMMKGKTDNVLVTALSLVPQTVPGTQWVLSEYLLNE